VLLLKSGITSGGRIGRRTFLHPVVAMLGIFDRVMNPFYGAPQSAASHQFIDRGEGKVGFFMEVAPLQPMLAAVAFNAFGNTLAENMAQLAHANGMISLSVDGLLPQDDGGVVTVRADGRPHLDYPIRPFLQDSFRASHVAMAKIQLAAGASMSGSLHGHNIMVRNEDDIRTLEQAAYGAHEHAIFTAHQMGGCTMGNNAQSSVVDTRHRHWDIPNLFVVDGSVLPTALGVNPSETIYAMARRAAQFVGEAV
jgi:choline dehydrogenase-like flavoprotein